MTSISHGLFRDKNNQAQTYASERWIDLVRQRAYKGVIFDCDGTLASSEEAHFRALMAAAADQGVNLEKEWYLSRTGFDRQALCLAMKAEFSDSFDAEQAAERSMSAFEENVHLVERIPSSHGFVKALAGENYKLAVGTNCETPLARASVSQVELLEHFSCIVSVSDGLPPKPSPRIFETAAERLSLERHEVLVVEDSPQGVQAAMDAEMDVLQLIHSDRA